VPQRFIGEPDRLRFVADLPDYLGQGGPHLHDIRFVDAGDARALEVDFRIVLGGEHFAEDPPRPPERLVDGLAAARFRYRSLATDGRVGAWQERWDAHDRLPLQVEITLRDADGRDWPPLVIALPLAGSYRPAGELP
jgi:general secretion pathway protein J